MRQEQFRMILFISIGVGIIVIAVIATSLVSANRAKGDLHSIFPTPGAEQPRLQPKDVVEKTSASKAEETVEVPPAVSMPLVAANPSGNNKSKSAKDVKAKVAAPPAGDVEKIDVEIEGLVVEDPQVGLKGGKAPFTVKWKALDNSKVKKYKVEIGKDETFAGAKFFFSSKNIFYTAVYPGQDYIFRVTGTDEYGRAITNSSTAHLYVPAVQRVTTSASEKLPDMPDANTLSNKEVDFKKESQQAREADDLDMNTPGVEVFKDE